MTETKASELPPRPEQQDVQRRAAQAAARQRPLVYSCSGCSSAAQLANHVALQLDRRGLAEMSCIAGVGGDVRSLVRLAQSGRPIIALDGCPLACVRNTLARHQVEPTQHYQLQQYGVKKRLHEDFDAGQAAAVLAQVAAALPTVSPQPPEPT
ncbi:MAG: putative zinc-binding protein [Burkholderiaceae bacterium]